MTRRVGGWAGLLVLLTLALCPPAARIVLAAAAPASATCAAAEEASACCRRTCSTERPTEKPTERPTRNQSCDPCERRLAQLSPEDESRLRAPVASSESSSEATARRGSLRQAAASRRLAIYGASPPTFLLLATLRN